MSISDKSRAQAISSTILQYRENLLKDINLKMRLVDDQDKTYLPSLIKWEDDVITFAAPLEQGDWVIFPIASFFECCFVTRQSMIITQLELLDRHRSQSSLLYKARIVGPLEKRQQRAHFRLDTLLPLSYAVLTLSDGTKLEEVMKTRGTCVNISVGGMCMVCDECLNSNQQLAIYLDFLDHDLILSGKVLGSGSRNENGTFSHRIQFYPLEVPKENLLSRLIFEKQRLQMQQPTNPLYQKTPR